MEHLLPQHERADWISLVWDSGFIMSNQCVSWPRCDGFIVVQSMGSFTNTAFALPPSVKLFGRTPQPAGRTDGPYQTEPPSFSS